MHVLLDGYKGLATYKASNNCTGRLPLKLVIIYFSNHQLSSVLKMRLSAAVLLVSSLLASAHPGEHHEVESKKLLLARREHQVSAARGLKACQQKRAYRDLQSRAIERRAASANLHRKVKRIDQTGVGHNLTDSRADINADSDDATVFGDSHICILDPEGDVGPYYVKGELVRSDVREGQAGVPIIMDGQFIDVETCEPIQGLYWDIWNCNATGVYAGVTATGNGNTNDATNVDNTFLRGIQQSDSDGVVQFLSVFPGHYNGRATHHHMVSRTMYPFEHTCMHACSLANPNTGRMDQRHNGGKQHIDVGIRRPHRPGLLGPRPN